MNFHTFILVSTTPAFYRFLNVTLTPVEMLSSIITILTSSSQPLSIVPFFIICISFHIFQQPHSLSLYLERLLELILCKLFYSFNATWDSGIISLSLRRLRLITSEMTVLTPRGLLPRRSVWNIWDFKSCDIHMFSHQCSILVIQYRLAANSLSFVIKWIAWSDWLWLYFW